MRETRIRQTYKYKLPKHRLGTHRSGPSFVKLLDFPPIKLYTADQVSEKSNMHQSAIILLYFNCEVLQGELELKFSFLLLFFPRSTKSLRATSGIYSPAYMSRRTKRDRDFKPGSLESDRIWRKFKLWKGSLKRVSGEGRGGREEASVNSFEFQPSDHGIDGYRFWLGRLRS